MNWQPAADIELHFTEVGMARALLISPGPVFAEKAVLEMGDGTEVISVTDAPSPPSQGSIRFTVRAPGFGVVRRVRMLASDGVCIALGDADLSVSAGDALSMSMTLH